MKTTLYFFLAAIAITFTACPVSLNFSPGVPGSEKMDKKFVGSWVAESDSADILKVTISSSAKNQLHAHVEEKGSTYSVESVNYKMWMTTIDGQNFVYLNPIDNNSESGYYVYHVQFIGKDRFFIEDTGLLVGGIDAVTSIEALREEISASMKNPECFSSRYYYVRRK